MNRGRFYWTEIEIIEIIGEALKEGNFYNGNVGVYPHSREIVFYDMVKKDEFRKIEDIVNELKTKGLLEGRDDISESGSEFGKGDRGNEYE